MRIPLHNAVFKMVLTSGKNLLPNEFIFHVPREFSKPMIKNYLESLYDVRVKMVHTVNMRGKIKKGLAGEYKRRDVKKAYVTIDDRAPEIVVKKEVKTETKAL